MPNRTRTKPIKRVHHPFLNKYETKVHYVVMIDSDGQIFGMPKNLLNEDLMKEIEKLAEAFRDTGRKAKKLLKPLQMKYIEVVDTAYNRGGGCCCCSGFSDIFIAIKEDIPHPKLDLKGFPGDFFGAIRPSEDIDREEIKKNVFRYCRQKWPEEQEFIKFTKRIGLYFTTQWDTTERLGEYVASMDWIPP
mmetsp:Transcript_31214/g.76141  ORF Transcript_31214/g.76141 Transcript_31214/m.76141 type:complete len:190 (-) Transcript_31214:306-875(-)|eukprot:CAMPEP_0114490918 /NCGR_PEP_ID=MMETSP0109-20121206/2710_1 /TAXON_ID=29199 /ORGANISM="Chlorarachnion reptans, Strain CCCM449" /LENGTH=189 /DNA_ID=CAMNT_0001667591 /DNA_START=327 /DNA_END=896 /DNA_ORIENTATION=+